MYEPPATEPIVNVAVWDAAIEQALLTVGAVLSVLGGVFRVAEIGDAESP